MARGNVNAIASREMDGLRKGHELGRASFDWHAAVPFGSEDRKPCLARVDVLWKAASQFLDTRRDLLTRKTARQWLAHGR
jgi:hypothetical protein